MAHELFTIRKVWRSEFGGVILFLFLCICSIFLSKKLRFTVIHPELFNHGNGAVRFSIPLLWLLPAYVCGNLLYRIYDVRYLFTSTGVEARSGILSLSTVTTRIRYEDILSVEVVQGLGDRFLNFGIVEISTAATGGVEIIMDGIAFPREVQEHLLKKRDDARKAVQRMVDHTIGEVNKSYALLKNFG